MKPMIDCDAVMRQLWDFLDGELTVERMAEIEAHVVMCGRCAPQVAFERSFKAAVRSSRDDGIDTSKLRDRVCESLRALGYEDPR